MRSVILLSGGVDSTVLLALGASRRDDILALTFNYGQTHVREVEAATALAEWYRVEHQIIPLDVFAPCVLRGYGEIPEGHADEPDDTVVPGRNMVLLSVGVALAEATGRTSVWFGANADDRAGYPDCRSEFVIAMDDAAYRGSGKRVRVAAPLITSTKREIVALGQELGVPFDLTWSCYRGGETPCNACGACESRYGAAL